MFQNQPKDTSRVMFYILFSIAITASSTELLRLLLQRSLGTTGWVKRPGVAVYSSSDRSTRALSSSIGRAALGVTAAAALAGVYGRHFLRFWLTLEIYFYFIYLWKYRQLNRKAHLPPLCEGPSRCPTRMERLKRCLRGLHEIHVHTAVNPTHSASEPMLERCTSQSQQLIGSKDPHQNLNKEAQSLLDVCSWSPSSRRRGRLGSVGSKTDFTCEQLVREWEQTHNKGVGFQAKLLANCSALLSMLQFSCNVIREDELPIHTGSGLFATEGSTVDDDMWAVRVRALLRAEISSWYFGAPVDSLQRGNLEEWVAEYFFEYRQADELSTAEKQELRVLVDYLAEWAHISGDLRDGTNEDVKCMRIMNDPIPAAYRPFICYGVTHFVLPIITDIVLDKAVGFTKYRSGTMEYWYSRAPEGENPTLQPIVFCHGLGVGLLPYIPFVRDIRRAFPDRDIFCIEVPHVAMRPYPNLPSAREMSVVVADMLTAWGYSQAHMIGHSFGTFVVRWMLAHEPSRIASLSLVDPVCFLLVKNDLLLNTQRKAHEDPIGILATYLVFRELYTAHTLTRNLFWEQNNVWPEELRGVPTHVSLCGRDFIIPAHSVRRLLEAEAAARLEIARDGQLNKFRRQQQPLKSRMSGRESLFQPLTVDWNDEGIHGEALNNGHWRRRVLRQIADLMKEK
ncbi:hypothetical protein FOZ60_003317 [Perkinsus olseni]|uniref:AB hydrolase-1 domain-containing protein n=1 Tax=Perkinsus olseni TaxID=32597 RepID=A0A7J6NWJ1_PEROL|nr:hypothetical protein FOZ60_003317 [Perkinsus olseni]